MIVFKHPHQVLLGPWCRPQHMALVLELELELGLLAQHLPTVTLARLPCTTRGSVLQRMQEQTP